MTSKTNSKPFDVMLVTKLDSLILSIENYPGIIRYGIGLLIILIGITLLVLPGPGILFILTGIALVSKKFGALFTSLLEKYITWRQRKKNS